MTRFRALEVVNWRQFGTVQIDFHSRGDNHHRGERLGENNAA